ncbi:MAG: hypothetical protein WC346_13810 [Methanogenium sp.]|jgi:hypothetical protein
MRGKSESLYDYKIGYFKLVKKDCSRSITVWFCLLPLYISFLVYGILNKEWLYLIMIVPIIMVFLAIINDVKRYNDAVLFLNENKENKDE